MTKSQSFSCCLRQQAATGLVPVIPDIKCVSPKDGDLLQGRNPITVARELSAAGAPVFSVVTEAKEFGGSLRLLEQVVAATGKPVLRKDFITCRQHLVVSAQAGATAVLLMAAVTGPDKLRHLFEDALDLGLEPLIEVHTPEEYALACQLPLCLLGINNKNILQLERDDGTVSTTAQLLTQKPQGAFVISESGILTPQQAAMAIQAGADGLLIGTAIWRAKDPVSCYRSFSKLGDRND